MHYQFLTKASQEPDLKDFTDYCHPLIENIESIQYKIKNLSISDKTISSNLDLNFKLDNIINKYLPNLVDNFLEISIKTRNTQKNIEINNNFFTAKEILLLNLSTITSEVTNIQSEIEQNYLKNIKVQSKIIDSQLGTKPKINSNGELEKKNIEQFSNTFDYDNFIENNIYKKDIPINNPIINESETTNTEDTTQNKKGFNILEILMVLSIMAVIMIGTLSLFSMAQEEALKDNSFSTLNNITENFKNNSSYDISKNNYELFHNPLIINYNKNEKTIEYNVKNLTSSYCSNLITYGTNSNVISTTVNDKIFDSTNLDLSKLLTSCQYSSNNVSFIVNLKK